MAVGAEARAALDAVFVYYAQGPKVFVLRVVVASEGEGVEGVEPAFLSWLMLVCLLFLFFVFCIVLFFAEERLGGRGGSRTMISVASGVPGAFLDLEGRC